MKCLVALLFLMAVAAGEPCAATCSLHGPTLGTSYIIMYHPNQFSGGYLTVGSTPKGPYMVKGQMAVDMPGRRIWSSYTAGPHKGEVLLLYKEDTMYIKTLGACFKKKIPEKDKFKLEELKSPKNAILLDSGHIANSKVLVNVYAAEEVKNGKKVHSVSSVTADHCILVSSTFKVEGVTEGQFNLFDVSLKVDEKKFKAPTGCREIPRQVSDSSLNYKLFR